jgi:hypothetical protein
MNGLYGGGRITFRKNGKVINLYNRLSVKLKMIVKKLSLPISQSVVFNE